MDERVVRGRCWLASDSERLGVPGTLTLSDDRFLLAFEGTVWTNAEERHEFSSTCRILGMTNDGKRYTLDGCQQGGYSTRSQGGDIQHFESYWPGVVCANGWFTEAEPLAFDYVWVRLSSLHPWTAVSGFDPSWQNPAVWRGGPVTQKYVPPPDYVAELAGGLRLKLTFPLTEKAQGLYTYEKVLTQATRFEFECAAPRAMDDVKMDVFTLRNFLSLAVGEPVKVTELRAYRKPTPGEDPPVGREVEIHYRQLESQRAAQSTHHHFMVFTLPTIADRFEDCMRRWFEGMTDLQRMRDLYFATMHVDFMYLESRFLNYMQAIEGYHRRRLNHPRYDEGRFKELQIEILDGLEGEALELATEALEFANEVKLRTRILEVFDHLQDPTWSILLAGKIEREEFAKTTARIRNDYAHNLRTDPPDQHELVVRTYQLRTLVEALLLLEIGFDPGAIDNMLRDARRYELIESVRNASLR